MLWLCLAPGGMFGLALVGRWGSVRLHLCIAPEAGGHISCQTGLYAMAEGALWGGLAGLPCNASVVLPLHLPPGVRTVELVQDRSAIHTRV